MNADGSNDRSRNRQSGRRLAPCLVAGRRPLRLSFQPRRQPGNLPDGCTDGSNVIRLSDTSAIEMDPTWSPDGSQLAFTSNRDGDFEIHVLDVQATVSARLAAASERIAFVSERGGNIDIYLMNADGSGVTRITDHPEVRCTTLLVHRRAIGSSFPPTVTGTLTCSSWMQTAQTSPG